MLIAEKVYNTDTRLNPQNMSWDSFNNISFVFFFDKRLNKNNSNAPKDITGKEQNSLLLIKKFLEKNKEFLMQSSSKEFIKCFKTENKYFEFLDSLLNETVLPENNYIHHIIPRHIFKKLSKITSTLEILQDSPFNTISLSYENHIKAHYLLHEIYGFDADLFAFNAMSGQIEDMYIEVRKRGAYSSHAVQKQNQTGFFDNAEQKRKAAISVENDRKNNFQARSKGGKIGGKTRWKNLIISENDRLTFAFNGQPFLCMTGCSTGGDVVSRFREAKPDIKIGRATRILKNPLTSNSGWSLVEIIKKVPEQNVNQEIKNLESGEL